ncbi:transposase [Streptomyces rimosus]|uniref:helix-turn-helix domain-containing protein n=1 Tax=Streptomyces rimosus TaxID=1927 RepID=UPI00099BC453|nr:winged helix-turn-helix domain-containing protein [Streptomyces rimosus]
MRYPQGGGLTAERRLFREHIRKQAAELFAQGVDNAAIARQLRVSVRSVQRWHRAWEDGGVSALESKWPAFRPKLSDALLEVLDRQLAKGLVAHGWPDQTWTLARIKTLIGRRFHKSMTLSAITQMLHRNGYSHQVPARRAVERDPDHLASKLRHGLRVIQYRGDLIDGCLAATGLTSTTSREQRQ